MSNSQTLLSTTQNTGLLDWGLVATFLGALITLIAFLYHLLLENKNSRLHLVDLIEKGHLVSLYRELVKYCLRKLQHWFGPSLSWKAFDLCLRLAFVYPVVFFISAFSWGNGSHEFSGEPIFDVNATYREWYLPILITYVAVFGAIFYKFGWIDQKGRSCFNRWFESRVWGELCYRLFCALLAAFWLAIFNDHIWLTILCFAFAFFTPTFYVVGIAAFTAATALTVAGTIVIYIAIMGAFAIAIVRARIGSSVSAYAFSIVMVIVIAFAISVAQFYNGNYERSHMLLLLLLLFPLINASLDWISWWFSRVFLSRASQEDKVWKIARDIVADLALGVLFMLALCVLLPISIELVNSFYMSYDKAAFFDWQQLARDARDDPWGEGLMVTLMLVTTLIPTFIHIILAIIAMVLQSFMGRPFLNALERYDEKNNKHNGSNIYLLLAMGCVILYLAGLGIFAALTFAIIGILNLDIPMWLYNVSQWAVS